jgi:hypothetical protein
LDLDDRVSFRALVTVEISLASMTAKRSSNLGMLCLLIGETLVLAITNLINVPRRQSFSDKQ